MASTEFVLQRLSLPCILSYSRLPPYGDSCKCRGTRFDTPPMPPPFQSIRSVPRTGRLHPRCRRSAHHLTSSTRAKMAIWRRMMSHARVRRPTATLKSSSASHQCSATAKHKTTRRHLWALHQLATYPSRRQNRKNCLGHLMHARLPIWMARVIINFF